MKMHNIRKFSSDLCPPPMHPPCCGLDASGTNLDARITFRGDAQANLTLDCTDTTWSNPNWTMGQIYSDREVKCAPVTLPVKPDTMTAVA